MTIIDLFRTFSENATSKGYSSSSRILYYTLLWCWNEQRRPEIAAKSSNQLMMLTGLPETTFREAFTYLADRGWVKRVKLRRRGVIAWCMRDGSGNAAPPAGFPLSPAQRETGEGRKIAESDFPSNTQKGAEDVHTRISHSAGDSASDADLSGKQSPLGEAAAMDGRNVSDPLWG